MAQSGGVSRKDAERRGRRAEWIAAAYLILRGHQILARRFRCRQGEIDLITRRGRTLCFVEVKARATHEAGIAAVTPTAEARIAKAATNWAAQNRFGNDLNWRFDIVTVARGRPKYLIDAFRPNAGQRILNQGDLF